MDRRRNIAQIAGCRDAADCTFRASAPVRGWHRSSAFHLHVPLCFRRLILHPARNFSRGLFAASAGAAATTDNGVIVAPQSGVPDWTPVEVLIGGSSLAFSFAIDDSCSAPQVSVIEVPTLGLSRLAASLSGLESIQIPRATPHPRRFADPLGLRAHDKTRLPPVRQPDPPSGRSHASAGDGRRLPRVRGALRSPRRLVDRLDARASLNRTLNSAWGNADSRYPFCGHLVSSRRGRGRALPDSAIHRTRRDGRGLRGRRSRAAPGGRPQDRPSS